MKVLSLGAPYARPLKENDLLLPVDPPPPPPRKPEPPSMGPDQIAEWTSLATTGVGAAAGYFGGIKGRVLGALVGASLAPIAAILLDPDETIKFNVRTCAAAATSVAVGGALGGFTGPGAVIGLGFAGFMGGFSAWMGVWSVRFDRYDRELEDYREAVQEHQRHLERYQQQQHRRQEVSKIEGVDIEQDDQGIEVGDFWLPEGR